MTKIFKYLLLVFQITILSINFNFLYSKTIKVLSKEEKIELSNATVKLIQNNYEKTLKTNEKGEFEIIEKSFKLPVKCIVSSVGYYRFNDTIFSHTNEIYLNKKTIITEEVVTTGQFVPKSAQESPFSIKVINQERIEAQGAVNLRDVMTNELNIRIGQDNVLGSSMNIRGISGQNVKILVDGVPIVGRVNGNIDISQINLNNAEKIEIIEGPLSTVYGTDALGGVINIITKNKYDKEGKLSINSFIESVGNYNFDMNYSKQIDNNLSLILNAGRNFFDGFDPVNENRRNILWKPKEQYFGDLNLGYNLKNWDFRYSFRGFFETIQNKGEPRRPYFENAFDDYYFTDRTTNSIFIKGKVYNEKYLDMIFSFNTFERRKNTFFKDLVTLNERLSTVPGDNDTTFIGAFLARGTFASDKSVNEKNENHTLSYQIGYDLNYEYVRGDRVQSNNYSLFTTMGDYATFFSVQYNPIKDILIQPSLRYAYNTNYDAPLIPAINFKADIIDNLLIRASYAKGFRAPSLRELYLFFVDINHNIRGNENLRAENSDTYGLNLEYTLQTDKAIVKFEPKLFYNDIRNQITLAFIEQTLYSYINVGQFKSQGAEFSVNCITEDITSKVGVSYIGRQNMLNENIQAPEMLYSTEFQGNILYDIKDYDVKLSLFYKYTGMLPSLQLTTDNQIQRFELNGFHTLDITFSKFFFEKTVNLTIGAKNLFNVTNLQSNIAANGGVHTGGSNSFASGVGRTVFTSLKFNL